MTAFLAYWNTPTGFHTITDDSAMYNGTSNAANSGGNYTGAANPSQAITNFCTYVGNYTSDGGEGSLDMTKSGGYFDQFSSGILAGKYVFCYEGGPDWPTDVGYTFDSHSGTPYTITSASSAFLIAVQLSSTWATTQIAVWNNYITRSNCYFPAQYLWENVNTGGDTGHAAYRWAYCSPDAYASGIEGQALLNASPWTAESAYNLGISDTAPPPTEDGRVLFRMGQR